MNVITKDGTATIQTPNGEMHSVPYTALGRSDMLLQAQYHQWARALDYRRELVCRLCKADFEVDSNVNEQDQAWELLMVCRCRAFYGKVSLRDVASVTMNCDSSLPTSSAS